MAASLSRSYAALVLLALVGAVGAGAAYEAGRQEARRDQMAPRVRALLARYDRDPSSVPPDSLFWLGQSLAGGNGHGPVNPALGQQLARAATAQGSLDALVDRGRQLLLIHRRPTEARRLFVEAMRRGEARHAFFFATLGWAGAATPDGLPAHADSLVRFYRSIQPLGGPGAARTVALTLEAIEREARAGRADARALREALRAEGLWDVNGARPAAPVTVAGL